MAVFSYSNKYTQKMAVSGSGSIASITEVVYEFSEEWAQIRYNHAAGDWMESSREVSAAAPMRMSISVSIRFTNSTSSPVTYNNALLYYGKTAGSAGLAMANIPSITIPAKSSESTTVKMIFDNPKYNYPDVSDIEEYVFSQNPDKHPYFNTLQPFTCPRSFTVKNGRSTLGAASLSDNTFNFTLPTIYDCRACNKHLTENTKYNGTTGVNVSPIKDISSNIISYTSNSDYTASYDLPNIKYRMPEMEIRHGSDVILGSDNFEVSPKSILTRPPRVALNNAARTRLCNQLRDSESRSSLTYSFNAYKRNPYKKGDLALGSLIFLDDGYCFTVTSNSGSGYYDSNWYLLDATGQSFTLTPTDTTTKISITGSLEIKYTLQNPVKLGCLYTEYTYPSYTFTYTVDWMTKKVNLAPYGSGWVDVKNASVELPLPTTKTQSGTYTFTQPAAYLPSFVPGDSKSVTIGATVTANIGNSNNKYVSTTVYKYVNLEIKRKDGYRVTQTGKQDVNGSYLGFLAEFVGSNMGGWNPISYTMKIVTLVNGQTVFEGPIKIKSGKIWVSDSSYVDDETSYKLTLTLQDKFRTRTATINIGTKVAFIEWGNKPGHMAVGKYIETNGLEIQFPTEFQKAVIFLAGGNISGDAAAMIPYNDTHGIGAKNVQEALNWILGRLS